MALEFDGYLVFSQFMHSDSSIKFPGPSLDALRSPGSLSDNDEYCKLRAVPGLSRGTYFEPVACMTRIASRVLPYSSKGSTRMNVGAWFPFDDTRHAVKQIGMENNKKEAIIRVALIIPSAPKK